MNLKTYTLQMFLTILLSTSVTSLNAQAFTRTNYGAQGGSLFYQIDPAEEEREGSPYFADEWRKGAVYNKNKTFAELDQMKYNVEKDELIFQYQGVQYIVPGKESIERFTLDNEEFIRAFDGKKTNFYQVVETGINISLLKKYSCSLIKGEPSKGYIPATKDRYDMKETFYLQKPGQEALAINPKKGSTFLSFVGDKTDEIEAFIRSNKLRMRTIEDLQVVVKHYNNIQ